MIYMFFSNNPSSGDINSSNLSCFSLLVWRPDAGEMPSSPTEERENQVWI